jgi:hypothetical protein
LFKEGSESERAQRVFSEGLTIRTLPVARAGAAFSMKIPMGALKGLIAAQTPRGSWRTSLVKPGHSSLLV